MKPTTTTLRLRPLLLLLAVLQQSAFYASAQPRRFQQGGLRSHWAVPTTTHPQAPRPGVADCDELYFEQPIDHFSYHPESNLDGLTFQQRYFVCGKQWWGGPGAPIFFYTGNEADVTLYLNASGLMWENAPEFEALLVFAEHRYYGKTQPLKPFKARKMDYLRYVACCRAPKVNDHPSLIHCPSFLFPSSHHKQLRTSPRRLLPPDHRP